MSLPWEHLSIRNSGPPLDAEAIRAAAAQVGLPFLPEYVEFLLARNGGSFRPWPEYRIDGCPRSEGGLLHCFFKIDANARTNLVEEFRVHRGRMPAELLPVASDPGGNLICLACTGEKVGRVFFWERAYEADTDAGQEVGWGNVFPIAENFPTFLRELH
jgi:hypothetical protein